jgi:hypothetical protein
MSQGQQRYTFEKLHNLTNNALMDKNMPMHLYKSINSISKVLDAIIQTKGKDWVLHVIDDDGEPLLSEDDKNKFQRIMNPYIDSILYFFDSNHFQNIDEINTNQEGGQIDISKLSGLSNTFLNNKEKEITGNKSKNSTEKDENNEIDGIDEIYEQLLNRVKNVDSTVNSYASKYGILRLEKEHDINGDLQIFPEAVIAGIADALFATSEGVILPEVTQGVLQNVKIPFRIIVVGIYLFLDIIRISAGVLNINLLRKSMSIIVSLIELLRGQWKKSLLTFMGYYGMTPMLFGQIIKVFITMFQMLAPQLQEDILLGVLDTTKSFIIGVLLSIFQITAPEQVRLPVIGALERIAQMKAKLDGKLIDAGMSARPGYLSPTFEDLNNIQAIISDETIICSSEFQEALQPLKKVALLKIILELMRIPTTEEFYRLKCGETTPKSLIQGLTEEAIKRDEDNKVTTQDKLQNGLQTGGRKLRIRK